MFWTQRHACDTKQRSKHRSDVSTSPNIRPSRITLVSPLAWICFIRIKLRCLSVLHVRDIAVVRHNQGGAVPKKRTREPTEHGMKPVSPKLLLRAGRHLQAQETRMALRLTTARSLAFVVSLDQFAGRSSKGQDGWALIPHAMSAWGQARTPPPRERV